jgi:SAM-dependent methyltransferase
MISRVRRLIGRRADFRSDEYWEQRYRAAGTSGDGSYGRLAEFKAQVLNGFVRQRHVRRVLELGCGDGNQLSLAQYPEYVGFDVSPTAVKICRERFAGQAAQFHVYDRTTLDQVCATFQPDLVLSLDVIFHLVEDEAFEDYMSSLCTCGSRYLIIYSSNGNFAVQAEHIRNWRFTDWMDEHAPEWRLIQRIPNEYPWDPSRPDETSFCEFYIFERSASSEAA